MSNRMMPEHDQQGRRAKAALALASLLAVVLIILGLGGIRALDRSGFDDAGGFPLIHKASRYANEGLALDMPMIGALGDIERQTLDETMDRIISSLWRKVRYQGETLKDYSRADPAKRKGVMDALLRETSDTLLKTGVSRAADALDTASTGVTPDGQPAYKWLILSLAQKMPEQTAQALRTELSLQEKSAFESVERTARADSQAIFGEAVAEKRLSRYSSGGAGMIHVARALFDELMRVSPEADLSPLMPLLQDIPKDTSTLEDMLNSPARTAIPAVLDGLVQENISGARLLALTRELYAALEDHHPDITNFDHSPLLLLQAEAMEPDSAQLLRDSAERLSAVAWNGHLAPLLLETLERSVEGAEKEDEMKLASLRAHISGEPAETIQDGLAGLLIRARDADTGTLIEIFLRELPQESAFETKARLISALFIFDAPKLPSSVQRTLTDLEDEERGQFRTEILSALADPDAPVPIGATEALEVQGAQKEEMLLYLHLLSGGGWEKLYGEEIATGLRLAVRGNGPRIRAAREIASGGGNLFTQTVNGFGKALTLIGVLLLVDAILLAFLMRSGRDWRFDVKWLLILLIVDFMLVFQILPLSYLLFRAFTPQGSFSLSTFGRLFNYEMNRSALVNTVVGGLSATVLGTLIAFPLAWLVGRTNLHGRKFFRRMFVLTYMVPPYVGAMAWLRLLNPNVGSINIALRGLFGLSGATGPINVYSLAGLVWVLTTFYYPYAFITISRAMEKMDPSLEEASRVAGASPFVTLARVTLPIMTPSLIAGALLVFVSAASCYGIPSIIGAPGKVHTVTTRIIEYYGRGTQGLNDATGLAIFLMVLAILILYLSDVVIAKKQYITVSGKSTRPNIVDLRAWRVPLTILVSLFAGLIVVLPFTTILTTSLKIDVGKSVLDAGNFTLNQWSTIFTRSETMDSLKNSLIFASVAATVGITVAITMSYLLQRTRIRGRRLPDFLITLGSGSPSVVIALGLIMSMQGRFGVNIYNTAYIIIVAYLIKYMMMGMRTVTSAISQIHVSLEESSQVAGASWLGTMRRVTGPLIFPSIAAGWFLIFIPCFYELSMTTLLYSNTTKTIGFQLYEYWTYTSQPQASAMAFGILLIVILINTVLNRLTKGEFSI